MKVLLVSGSYPPMACGVGDYTAGLACALARMPATDVGVFTSFGAENAKDGPVEVFPAVNSWRLSEAPAFTRILKEWAPAIVHIQYPTQRYGRGLLPTLVPVIAASRGARIARTWHEAPAAIDFPRFLLQSAPPGAKIVVRPNFIRLMHPANRPLLTHGGYHYIMGASAIPASGLAEPKRAALRLQFLADKQRLIVFFGFLYPPKGVEQLFDIADPRRDRIVIAGPVDVDPSYQQAIEARAQEDRWRGSVTFAGYLDNAAAADLLAAADAVVLPFLQGGGTWNSSIHAAILQGTPVVTTSTEWQGLDEDNALYAARPGDIEDMRQGLELVAGKRRIVTQTAGDPWAVVAERHLAVYRQLLASPAYGSRN